MNLTINVSPQDVNFIYEMVCHREADGPFVDRYIMLLQKKEEVKTLCTDDWMEIISSIRGLNLKEEHLKRLVSYLLESIILPHPVIWTIVLYWPEYLPRGEAIGVNAPLIGQIQRFYDSEFDQSIESVISLCEHYLQHEKTPRLALSLINAIHNLNGTLSKKLKEKENSNL